LELVFGAFVVEADNSSALNYKLVVIKAFSALDDLPSSV
jgi:hypothetical protein